MLSFTENQLKKIFNKIFTAKYPKGKKVLVFSSVKTAVVIIDLIKDLSFEDVTQAGLYSGWGKLARLFQAQIELAAINPKKFCENIYKFFCDISLLIKKEKLEREFFELYQKIRVKASSERDETDLLEITDLSAAFLGMILQCSQFLKPDKLKFDCFPCGISTEGTIMTDYNPFGKLHVADYEIKVFESETEKSLKKMLEAFSNNGFEINSVSDLNYLFMKSKNYMCQRMAMISYINEYNFDILAKEVFDVIYAYKNRISIVKNNNFPELAEILKIRKKSLPVGGAICKIKNLHEEDITLILKETVLEEEKTVVLLYKLITPIGDLNGYFNTKTTEFYSLFMDVDTGDTTGKVTMNQISTDVKDIVLAHYAFCVLDSNVYTGEWLDNCFVCMNKEGEIKTLTSEVVFIKNPSNINDASPKEGNTYYKKMQIASHSMKLPAGRVASDEAIEFARQYGYDLEPGYTYVRSFEKRVAVNYPPHD